MAGKVRDRNSGGGFLLVLPVPSSPTQDALWSILLAAANCALKQVEISAEQPWISKTNTTVHLSITRIYEE